MPRRLPGRAIQAGTITVTQLETSVANTVQTGGGPKITNVEVTSNSYVVLDDTAVDIAGGYIKITGTGFAAGCQVLINNTPATSTTYIGPTEVRAQLPATAAGTYMLYLINADGGVAIRVNGVTFSATPSWVTASDLTSYALGDAISIQLSATGASTFALAAGSTLPTGLTLSAGGLLSGSVTGLENDTSYSFTITAIDAENQDSPRTFSISITVQLQVSRSLRFNRSDTAYLTRTFAVNGDRQRWTWSGWIKRSSLGTLQNIINSVNVTPIDGFYFDTNDTLKYRSYNGTSENVQVITTQVFRETSSWYHLVVALDTTQATAANRLRMYINGSEITAFSTATYPTQNFLTGINLAGTTELGSYAVTNTFNGYMTEVYFIDGQQLTPAAFAETNTTTGQYIPKKYTGTYGTNGFYLPFTDNSSVANLGRNYQPLTADPFWNRTVLLLNGTGSNNANNNTFIDSSTNAFAITRNGNTTQGRFSPFTQGGWSNYFNGSSSLTPSSGSFLAFGTSNYTIEFWVFLTQNVGNNHALAINANNGLVVVIGDGKTSINSYNVGDVVATTTGLAVNVWNHVAIVRSGTGANQTAIYINGIRAALGTDATNWSVTTNPRIGGNTASQYIYGYLNNIRVVTSAVYTNNFIPPTSPLQAIAGTTFLTGQSNRFIDLGSTGATFTTTGSPSVVAFSPFTLTTAYSAATHGGSGYFDGSGDYLTADNLNIGNFGTDDFTIECWFYANDLANYRSIAESRTSNGTTTGWALAYDASGTIYFYSNAFIVTSGTGAVILKQWNHVAVTRQSGTNRLFLNGALIQSSATSRNYTDNNFKIATRYDNAGEYFNGYISSFRVVKGTAVYTAAFTPPTAPVTAIANTSLLVNFTNAEIVDATGDNNIETVGDAKISTAQSKWAGSSMLFDGTGDNLFIGSGARNFSLGTSDFTIECWFRHNGAQNSDSAIFSFSNANFFVCHNNAASHNNLITVWIDPYSSGLRALTGTTTLVDATWYHLAISRAGGVWRLFLNGVQEATYTNSADPLPAGAYLTIGSRQTGNYYYKGYIQDFRITLAARYTGNFTPPTAQFAYNQGDINYNQWVPTNFSVTAGAGNDSLLDVPTNWGVDTGLGGEVRGNYPTLSPLHFSTTSAVLTNGGLDLAGVQTTAATGNQYATMALPNSGKWYWEVQWTKMFADWNQQQGILNLNNTSDVASIFLSLNGQATSKNRSGTQTALSPTTVSTNDIIQVAVDIDAGKIWFGRNNTWYESGNPSTGANAQYSNLSTTGRWMPFINWYTSQSTANYVTCSVNFGQRPFAYAAPSGFKSLNTHNLPALAVTKSNTAFDAVLWTGDGNTTRSITGLQFSPDLLWYKNRSVAVNNYINDTIRGAGAGTHMHTNTTDTEASASVYATNGGLQSFDANGFTGYKGSDATYQAFNLLNNNYVAWAWDAGTTTVVNTAGSISANVRVNASAGTSIATFATLAGGSGTFGHGLGVAPKFIIQKSRTGAQDWYVYHASLGASAYMLLNSSAASVSSTAVWGGTTPSSAIVTLGSGWTNNNHGNVVAYCFAEIPGFSSFSSWTGNGSADGPFIYTGFRPAFVMAKQTNTGGQNWYTLNNKSSSSNVVNRRLYPNLTLDEAAPDANINCDFLSNGFKIRDAYTGWNASGGTYIYAAFAESPFKYARAR
jgi:hypothetical protein